MSSEEIIRAWKADDEDENEDEQDPKDLERPENPAGDQELTDEELKNVGGGSKATDSPLCTTLFGIC